MWRTSHGTSATGHWSPRRSVVLAVTRSSESPAPGVGLGGVGERAGAARENMQNTALYPYPWLGLALGLAGGVPTFLRVRCALLSFRNQKRV